MPNLLEQHGARSSNKDPKFVPLFIDRAFTGLFTQRAALHDPSDLGTLKYYGGRPDSLWAGSNCELTNRLTLQRRPGLSPFSTVTYPTAPDRAFSFELINGTIQVIIDTISTGNLSVTSVNMSSGNFAIYTGNFPCAGNNAYVGMQFQITGFLSANNNGVFTCIASTTTTLTLLNSAATPETDPAIAISAGAVFVDNQNGTKTLLFGKSVGAGQTYFVAVAGVLYMGDGVDTKKYTPLNTNGTIWNWGIVAPSTPPSVLITETANAAVNWQANTWFSTMGIVIDSHGYAQQLVSVNNDPANNPNTTQFGLPLNGAPPFSTITGGTITDGTVVWRCRGPIGIWKPVSVFAGISGSDASVTKPAMIYDAATGGYYANSYANDGTTGQTRPPFTGTLGEHFFDPGGNNTCNWVCYANPFLTSTGPTDTQRGALVYTWQKNHAYSTWTGGSENSAIVTLAPPPKGTPYPTNAIPYYQTVDSPGGTSQATAYDPWGSVIIPKGTLTSDNQLQWMSLGSATWTANTPYSGWTASNSPTFSCIKETANTGGTLWVCTLTGNSGTTSPWATNAANLIVWAASTAYQLTQKIVDSNGNIQKVTTVVGPGLSGAGSHPVWGTTLGSTTSDNNLIWTMDGPSYGIITATETTGVTWACVGTSAGAVWSAQPVKYYLPVSGFSPPSKGNPYGSAAVIDSNNSTEFVLNTGVSGMSAPSWSTTVGGTTADSTNLLWRNNGAIAANSLSWQKGIVYAYSFKARSLTDFYSVNVPGTNKPPIPPGANPAIPLPPPTGSETGAVSTASPVFIITGPNAGAINTLTGLGSTDPQVDTIVIWRSADGGGAGSMFELTEIPAPPPVGGQAQTWTFADFLPDTPKFAADGTTLFPGLNPLIPAPINHVNDPPAANFLPMIYNFQRIWGAEGQQVNFSGGPDTPVGNPNENFNPADELPFLSNVTALVKTTQGIVTFLTNSIELIAGGPLTASFFSVTLCPNVGLMSFNELDVHAGEIYFFSADNQFYAISPSLNLSRAGFPIGDQLANMPSSGISDTVWDSSKGYLAVHQNGIDNGIYLADGSTGWYRVNPYQTPGGYQGPEPIWSPYASITNGCRMVQSIETAPGIKKLLVGPSSCGKQILYRDITKFTDNGTAYGAFFTLGSIMLVHPGQLAVLKFLEADFSGKQYNPTMSFLLNEISGTFTPFTTKPQFDPPSIYGTSGIPGSYSPNRWYFSSTKSLARCRHMQIKVDLGVTPNGDELMNLTIFGRLMQEF